jgi:ketosteroid isomerase-like protein
VSERDNTELVQQAYGAFQSGDITAVLDTLSEDVEWVIADIEGVPVGGTRHGREQTGEFFQTLSETQEVRQFEPREFVAQGDKVVALGH